MGWDDYMPKRISKRQHNDVVYGLWFKYLCTYGLRQAKKIVFEAYKELRKQDNEQKKVR